MSALAELGEWYRNARKNDGLLDVKIFPGSDTRTPPEETAALVLKLLKGELETVDITDSLP